MKNLFNKITSQLNEVTKRTLIVLQFPLPIFLITFNTVKENWIRSDEVNTDLIFLIFISSLSFSMAFFIIVATVNWILKGKGK